VIEKIIKELYSVVEEDDAVKKFKEILETQNKNKIKKLLMKTIFEQYFGKCENCHKKIPIKDMEFFDSDGIGQCKTCLIKEQEEERKSFLQHAEETINFFLQIKDSLNVFYTIMPEEFKNKVKQSDFAENIEITINKLLEIEEEG